MGGAAAGELWRELKKEWEEGAPLRKPGGSDAAQLMREATQVIPGTSAQPAVASKVIDEIIAVRQLAWRDGVALPELSAAQMQTLANWAATKTAAADKARALARLAREPLPPAAY